LLFVFCEFLKRFDFLLCLPENAGIPGTLNYRAGLPETRPLPERLLWSKPETRAILKSDPEKSYPSQQYSTGCVIWALKSNLFRPSQLTRI